MRITITSHINNHIFIWFSHITLYITMSCWGMFIRRKYQFSSLLKWHQLNIQPMCHQRGFRKTTAVKTYDVRKVELTPLEQRKLTFDSHALVKELETSGFEKRQAEVIVTALVTLTTANMDIVYRDMVTGAHQEIALQQIMAHLDAIRKDMVILEKSEFANLRSENAKMKAELEHIKNRLLEESQKIRADAKLDINLERSRVTDMFTEQEKKLMEVRTEFQKMNADTESEAIETSKKIDIQVASLKTLLESLKLETIRYLAACIFTCLAIALGFYRFWK
ncbi:coiled-coil domain-containing protein 90B, mitochondrial-like [Sinocyclocheilus rhinocerous]|uniref:coiled-coil domain-containing protein 90B, mitochondrial-like n=1 Tax=Sinocyclocheilus rhinocerous TaxID=307959 RepID=UPI0007BA76AF|nr:PREDICTED: coiled-coil domain-containing protein 90B, mitochondrial-like [Sinocyclocheilus rhinocerous]